jgi:predicted MPP superfamily phosphohydrolase
MRRNPRLIATSLSLLLHGYVAWSLLPALALTPAGLSLALIVLLASALLVPAPLLIRLSTLPERYGDALAWAGYLAMGAFSTLLVLCLLRDALLLAAGAFDLLWPQLLHVAPLRRDSALAVLALAAGICLVGFLNARRVARVVHVDLPIENLPPALSGFTIVQLSDIHVGPTIKRSYLEAIVREVNALEADVIALTGDLVDGAVSRLRPHVAPLEQLRARYGAYCVTGNHEYYHGVEGWLQEWRRLGLRVLLNQAEVLHHRGERLLIAGVTDYSAHHIEPAHRSDADAAVRSEQAVALKLLLAHQPRSAPAAAAAGFHIQLSGHTHGGQFLPWNFFVPLQQPFVAGLNRFGGLWVYTSRGTGYWGPPLRFGAT